jgi:hypothetical protein
LRNVSFGPGAIAQRLVGHCERLPQASRPRFKVERCLEVLRSLLVLVLGKGDLAESCQGSRARLWKRLQLLYVVSRFTVISVLQ